MIAALPPLAIAAFFFTKANNLVAPRRSSLVTDTATQVVAVAACAASLAADGLWWVAPLTLVGGGVGNYLASALRQVAWEPAPGQSLVSAASRGEGGGDKSGDSAAAATGAGLGSAGLTEGVGWLLLGLPWLLLLGLVGLELADPGSVFSVDAIFYRVGCLVYGGTRRRKQR